MRMTIKSLGVLTLAALSAFAVPLPAEGQILKKLAKGIEKVNKALDKVDNATKKDNKKAAPANPNARNDGDKGGNGNGSATTKQSAAARESGFKSAELTYNTPYIDSLTRFMPVPNIFDGTVSDVNENIFAVKHGQKYAFWRVDGRKLYDADWEYCGESSYISQAPVFNSGVTAARRTTANAAGKKPICLLYADGHVKELDPSYKEVTVFADGLALVTQEVNYKKYYFYINVRGEKQYPALNVSADTRGAIRPLRCGLRAFYGLKEGKWGFIDAKGNVVIAPKYKYVRDFSEDFAWVMVPKDERAITGTAALIDRKGNVVFTPQKEIVNEFRDLADVSDGLFYCQGEYFDTAGNSKAGFRIGTGFYGGYAFVGRSDGYVPAEVVNTSFDVVRTYTSTAIKNTEVPAYLIDERRINFQPYGLSTTRDMVLTPDGRIILQSWDPTHTPNKIDQIKQFSASGYALASADLGGKRYIALLEPDGHVAWLFSDNKAAGDLSQIPPIDLPPIDLPPVDDPLPLPPPIEPVDPETPPIGPTMVTQTTYKVTAHAEPAEGGGVSLSSAGPHKYGDVVTLTATPASKDWAVLDVTSSAEGYTVPKPDVPFPVVTDMDLTVKFVKADDDLAPESSGAFQGKLPLYSLQQGLNLTIPVYAQISAEKADNNPYGEHTYGFLAPMFDAKERIVMADMATYIFAAPLRICGVQKDDDGRQWLVVDGGSWTLGNFKVNPKGNAMAGLFFNAMLAFDGHSNIGSLPRHYRIEMTDIDAESGAFTLGNLQTYSPTGRWVPGGDRSLTKTTKGMFCEKRDYGYPADFFKGVRLEPARKRDDVQWTPPIEWYDSKQSLFESAVRSIGSNYRNASSDYYKMFPHKK